jgi:hypothetical protein
LGKLGSIELHVFTENGHYKDIFLSRMLHEMRYDVLARTRKPIFCTAVCPDHSHERESNPHDALPSTKHFVAINSRTGDLEYALSAARYSSEFGVPLENRYKRNGYPEGASLDRFKSKYLFQSYGIDKDIEPARIVEIYRHIRNPRSSVRGKKALGARLGVYLAAYQELVRFAFEAGKMPADLWVWDAIPPYADKYAYVGGIYRDIVVRTGRYVPTWKSKKIIEKSVGGAKHCYLANEQVTRSVPVLFPPLDGSFSDVNKGEIKPVGMVDGLIDIKRNELMVKKHPYLFAERKSHGFGQRMGERLAMSLVARRAYLDHHPQNISCRFIEFAVDILWGTRPWKLVSENNRIGHSLIIAENELNLRN